MSADFEDSEYFRLLAQHAQTWHLGGSRATETLLARIDEPRQKTLLEIGCGSGKTLQRLTRLGVAQIHALDRSPRVLQWAADAAPEVVFSRADAHHLPAADSTFDVVLIESVLIFCDLERVLAEVRRVLKPGGALLLNELIVLNETVLAHVDKIDAFIGSPVLNLQTQETWHAAFQRAGFTLHWQARGQLPRLKLFLFLQTLGLLDEINDEQVLTYGLYHLISGGE